MDKQVYSDEASLRALFHDFLDAGLHGRFADALAFIEEPYTGVGMGEQGIVHSKAEAELILRDGYRLGDDDHIEFEIKDFTVNVMSADVAVLTAEVFITSTPTGKNALHSGLMQTIGACRKQGGWRIVFSHSSPTVLTAESVEAYPIRFLDNTLFTLKADLQAKGVVQRDALTGILNREGFDNRVAELMKDYDPKHNTALFMVDLDDFKQINDRLGHQTGDAVLQQVAEGLQGVFRTYDAVGRIGGDEFMVFLTGDFTAKFLETKANELLGAMRLQVGDSQQVPVSVSIGVAYGRARVTFEKLYRIADVALYSAKKAGKCRYHLINSDTNTQHTYHGTGANLLSLQALLENTSAKEIVRSKTPYEALTENIPGGVVIYEFTDTTIKVTHCNEWFCRLLDYTEEEVEAREVENPLAFVHPDDVTMMLDAVQSIRDGADNSNVVYRAIRKDGGYSYINQTTTVTERRRDSIILYGIESDVSAMIALRQEAENARRELEAIIANVPGSVVMFEFTESAIKSTHRNTWLATLLGYTDEELIALQAEDPLVICHPDDLTAVRAAVQSIRDGADTNSIDYRVRHRDGTYRHMAQTVSVVARRPGSIILYGIETDVEETYRLQQEVESSQKEMETLIQTIPGGVLSIAIGDHVLLQHRNNWVARHLGYSQEELGALEKGNGLALVHPEDLAFVGAAADKLRAGDKSVDVTYRLQGRDGIYRHVRINASKVERHSPENLYYGIVTDVEEIFQVREKLEQFSRKLEALLSAIPGGIAIFELGDTFKVTQYGSWFCKFSGYNSDEEIAEARHGKDLSTIWPDDIPKAKEVLRCVQEEGLDRFSLSVRIKCKDGTPKPVDIRGAVIERSSQKVTMYVIYTEPM